MDHSKGIVLLLLFCTALGCASVSNYFGRPFRKPGERLKTFPEKVWQQYDCEDQALPFFEIERLELHPRRLEPGGEFSHRLVYVLCPPSQTAVVTGRLDTRILHRGEAIVSERNPTYDIKPGRWVIDAFVRLPETAKTGIYAFELEFRSPTVEFMRSLTFAVDASNR